MLIGGLRSIHAKKGQISKNNLIQEKTKQTGQWTHGTTHTSLIIYTAEKILKNLTQLGIQRLGPSKQPTEKEVAWYHPMIVLILQMELQMFS